MGISRISQLIFVSFILIIKKTDCTTDYFDMDNSNICGETYSIYITDYPSVTSYQSGSTCTITFKSASASQKLMVETFTLNLYSSSSFLRFYDGSSTSSPRLRTFNWMTVTKPGVFKTTGRYLAVSLKKDAYDDGPVFFKLYRDDSPYAEVLSLATILGIIGGITFGVLIIVVVTVLLCRRRRKATRMQIQTVAGNAPYRVMPNYGAMPQPNYGAMPPPYTDAVAQDTSKSQGSQPYQNHPHNPNTQGAFLQPGYQVDGYTSNGGY